MSQETKFPYEHEQLKELARKRLTELNNPGRIPNWTHISGGAESGSTWKRNMAAYEALGFDQVTISDVEIEKINLGCNFFGAELKLPIGVGPMASGIEFTAEDAFVKIAKACEKAGVAPSAGYPTSSRVAHKMVAECKNTFKIIKPLVDLDKLISEVKACEEAGCLLTGVDTDSVAGLKPAGDTPHFPGLARPLSVSELKEVRESVKIPFILKGILSEKDVRSALEIGADGIVVSTHAGYAMDYAPSPLEVIRKLKKASNGQLKIIVDSGITRGSDIVKALCLGADAVFLGRLIVWGLLFGGEEGVSWILSLMAEEMRHTMALLGVKDIKDLSPECLLPLNEMGKNILA